MTKKILNRCLFGAPMGLTVWFLFLLWAAYLRGGEIILASGHAVIVYGSEWNAVAAAAVSAMLIGMIWAGASLIYQETDWNLPRQTAVHALVCVVPSLVIVYVMEWMPRGRDGLGQYLGLFAGIYALIWAVQYLGTRRRLKQINAMLKDMDAE